MTRSQLKRTKIKKNTSLHHHHNQAPRANSEVVIIKGGQEATLGLHLTFTQFRRSVLNQGNTAVADYHETFSFGQSYDDSVVMHICKSLCARKIGPKLLFRIHFVAVPENTDENRDRRESKLHKHKQFFGIIPL